MSQMRWLLWLKLVVDSRDLGVPYKGYPLHISCWKNECEAITHYIWLKIWSAWLSCAFGSRDGLQNIFCLCMTHDSHRVCSKIWYKFWQFSSNWRGRDQKPSFACLKISASIIKSHHQTDSNKTPSKFWRNHFYIQIKKWGMDFLLKQKEQQGTHHFHFKKRRFVSKGTSGAAVWLGCFTEAAGGMDTAGSHCCPWWQCVFFLGLNHLTLSRYCR